MSSRGINIQHYRFKVKTKVKNDQLSIDPTLVNDNQLDSDRNTIRNGNVHRVIKSTNP